MKVFIEYKGGIPVNVDAYNAEIGFGVDDVEIEQFDKLDLISGRLELDCENVYVGSLSTTLPILSKLLILNGYKSFDPLWGLDCKREYFFGRKIQIQKLSEVREVLKKWNFGGYTPAYPFFIKPSTNLKSFDAKTVTDFNSFYEATHNQSNEDEVVTSEVVDFVSEYRCFIHKNKIVDIRRYSGSFEEKHYPEIGFVEEVIKTIDKTPIAFTVDVGSLKHKEAGFITVVVECNDFFSIGSYGLDPVVYSQMLKDRWLEITNPKK